MKYPIPQSLGKAMPGDIGNMHTCTTFGWLMGHSPLGKAYHRLTGDDARNCPSHSILFVIGDDGELCVGDVTPPTSLLISLDDFARQIQDGKITNFRLLRPAGATPEQGIAAARWWRRYVINAPYDYWAYPRLIFKTLFWDWIPRAAGNHLFRYIF